jgi:hypothetical protein
MPSIMSLEGPQITHLDEIRSHLYAATPRGLWGLRGFTEPFLAHPLILALGIIGGAWLAGSKTGQGLVSKFAKKPATP